MEIRPIRIFLVDDDEEDIFILKDIISEIPSTRFEVEWTSGYDTALQKMLDHTHDVYLIDYRLDIHNGLDLLRTAVEKGCRAPLILITGKGDHEVDMEAMRVGAADYLVKGKIDADLLDRVLRYSIERKRVEEALRNSEEKYRTLFNHIADPVLITGKDSGKFLDCNHAVKRMYGYNADEMKELTPYDLHPKDEHFLVKSIFKEAEQAPMASYTHLGKHGKKMDVEISSDEIDYQGAAAWVSIIRDVTEHKRAQAALARLAQELTRANAEMGGFMTIVEEKFRKALADTLENGSLKINDGTIPGQNVLAMLDSLIDYWKIGSEGQDFMEVDTAAILETALKNHHERIEETSAEITQDDLPQILADEKQLFFLFDQLLDNALKYCGEAAPKIHFSASDQEVMWLFSVKDNGPGFAKNDEKAVFDLFHRLDSSGGEAGMGMGLAFCRKIIERHRGSIWAEAVPGKGATFFFSIPKWS